MRCRQTVRRFVDLEGPKRAIEKGLARKREIDGLITVERYREDQIRGASDIGVWVG